MAKRKGPDLSSPAENPNYDQHVDNVSTMVASATPEQHINGAGWYRKGAQDAAHITMGLHPGTMTPHPTHGDVGLSHDKPGSSPGGAGFIRNSLSDAKAQEMTHARSLGQDQAEDLARSGRYAGQQVSHANDSGRPFGLISHSPAVRQNVLSIAAMSPAGPTGMTWDNNPKAVADLRNLSEAQFGKVVHANTIPVGTPERKAASAEAREPFKGTALNHQTTPNVEKGGRAIRGEYDGIEHPLGEQKTQHFNNDLFNEFAPDHAENREGMTGTIDKHQQDVIAGNTKPWGTTKDNGDMDRSASTRAVGEDSLPSLSSDAGYAYHRDVVHAAARRNGMRPKEAQATSWVVQKYAKFQAALAARSKGATSG